MATSDSFLLKQIKGMIGKQLVFKQYYDKTVISKSPNMSKRVLSEKQEDNNRLMAYANNYAKLHYYDEELKKAARERLQVPPRKSLFHALVKEYMVDEKLRKKLEEDI